MHKTSFNSRRCSFVYGHRVWNGISMVCRLRIFVCHCSSIFDFSALLILLFKIWCCEYRLKHFLLSLLQFLKLGILRDNGSGIEERKRTREFFLCLRTIHLFSRIVLLHSLKACTPSHPFHRHIWFCSTSISGVIQFYHPHRWRMHRSKEKRRTKNGGKNMCVHEEERTRSKSSPLFTQSSILSLS